jgi:hypothetical protein
MAFAPRIAVLCNCGRRKMPKIAWDRIARVAKQVSGNRRRQHGTTPDLPENCLEKGKFPVKRRLMPRFSCIYAKIASLKLKLLQYA